jgi:dolichol-phosphate mannosyltransferase
LNFELGVGFPLVCSAVEGVVVASPAVPPRILVTLATYNERDNLAPLIHAIHAAVPTAEVLVIDDNSPDGTGQLADELAAGDARIHVLHRPGKLGLGTAILAGVHYALDQGYDWLVNMDADFSHHPRYLPALLEGMAKYDVMIGSRYVPGGGMVNWPWSRRFLSWAVNAVVRLLLRIPAHDSSGAYRCYRVATLRQTNLENLLSHGYSFQEEMLYRCCQAGCRLGETPIIFENRRAGASKVDLKEMFRSMAVLLRLGLQAVFNTHHVRGQKSEVRDQKSEVRGQKSEVKDQKSEIR